MGTGIWANFHWESGIWVTGTGIWSLEMGITNRKTIELGLRFLKFGKTIGCEMGFGQNLAWENGIYTPPSGPSTLCLNFVPCQTTITSHHFTGLAVLHYTVCQTGT